MKLTITDSGVYTYVFQALFREADIPFIRPAQTSRYTLKLGSSFGSENLDYDSQLILGSFIESFYLGADTAVILSRTAPNYHFRETLNYIFEQSGFKMKTLCYKTDASLPAFALTYGKNKNLKQKQFAADFYDCLCTMDSYVSLIYEIRAGIKDKNQIESFSTFCSMAEKEMDTLTTLSSLKIFLRLIMKKAERFREKNEGIFAIGFLCEKHCEYAKILMIRKNLAEEGLILTNIPSVSANFKNRAGFKKIIHRSIKTIADDILENRNANAVKGMICETGSKLKLNVPVMYLSPYFTENELREKLPELKNKIKLEQSSGTILSRN